MKKTDGIIGLGGGVVGDLSGFVAATIFRGVPYIAIPTTLLAQVDSSIGSKVGINTSLGKNLLGAFKDPLFVFIYPGFLKTLSTRELNNGLAEVIKAGFIQDATILSDLESNVDLNNVIYKAVKVKVAVVLNDPLERHERKTLNFGHTLGHAIEKGFLYEGIKHGEAISHGMIFALKLGIKLHITSNETLDYALTLLNKYHLLDIQIGSYETYLNDVIYDKKSDVKGIDFILITKPGNVLIKHIPYGELNVD
jgi:3-dehydroquinate synthase